jgi:hypothetical protein
MKRLLLLLPLFIFLSCIEDDLIIPDSLQELEFIIPDGWQIGISTDYHPSGTICEGLHSPDVVAVFVNRDSKFDNLDRNNQQYPSLVLNFFDISKIDQIDSIMKRYVSINNCAATPYDTTAQYFVLSSRCLQNHGFQSEQANSLVEPLHTTLHSFFDDLK